MKKEDIKKITSFKELQLAKGALKNEIYLQELDLQDSEIVKFFSFILSGKSIKEPLLNSLASFNLKSIMNGPIGSILNTFFMTNKFTRKYYVPFFLAKELVPFAIQKINEIFKSDK